MEFKSFPDYLAPDEEKDLEPYGLAMGQAIQYEWFKRNQGKSCSYYDRRGKYHNLRLYARGEQSPDIYKKLLSKGKTSYANYDWRPLQVIPKFVKLITNQMTERLYEINIEATDKFSTDLRNKQKDYLQNVVASKPIFDLAQQSFGVNIAPPNMEELPQTNEEVDLWMDMRYKPSIEIAAEEAIKYTLDYNDFDEIQSKILEDITVIGIGALKHSTDPTKGILLKYVDPANLVYSTPRQRDFKDVHYYGEVERMTVNELKRISGTRFTDKEISDIGYSSRIWTEYHQNNDSSDLQGMMVDVLNFTFKTTNVVTYKKKFTKTGGYNMTKKDSSFNVKKDGEDNGYQVVKKTIDVWYEGSLILGTDFIFNYKKCENMIRPEGLLNKTVANYVVFAPELYQNRTSSLVSRIIPYVDQMQQVHIKLQQMVAKARPNGIYIDIDGLGEVDLGSGIVTPLELIQIYDDTGNIIGTSINAEGDYNYGKEPIKELKNGIIDGIDRLINVYNHYLNLLRDAIGIPAGADASTPRADMAVGVQEQLALNSNTATRHILDGTLNITKNTALGLSLRLKDIFKYSDLKDVYINAIGKLGVEALRSMQDYALYDLGINIEIKPDAQEKSYLEQNIQMALSRDAITIPDAIDIRSITNVKLANKVIETRIKQRDKEKKKNELDMIQANSQSQIQSAQAASESRIKEIQVEMEGKIALKQAEIEGKAKTLGMEAELKGGLMDKEFEYNMKLRGMDIQIKSEVDAKKEDNKFKLQNLSDTNDSKKIEQKKFNKPAINFESSEDNVNGSMDMSEMNPS